MPKAFPIIALLGAVASVVAPVALAPAFGQSTATPASSEPPANVVPPRLVDLAAPSIEMPALAQSIEVGLLIVVDADGLVTEASITSGAGEPWDRVAQAALLASLFDPALIDGEPRAVQVAFTYVFEAEARRQPVQATPAQRRDRESTPGRVLRGTLLEKGTRAPLEGVLVLVSRPGDVAARQVLTDETGRFTVEGLDAGDWRVEVVEGDHAGADQSIELAPSRFEPDPSTDAPPTTELDPIYLAPARRGLYQTVVQGKRDPPSVTEVVLRDEELRKIPGTFGDPTRVVATLPGVARSPFGLGFYVVRGASFENSGFFIDGHPALFLYHFLGGPSVIHPQLVGELRFYPGGYPAEFGRLAGGVIALKTADPPVDRWHLDVEVDALKSSAMFSIPFDDGKGVVTVAGRRSYFELFLPLVVDGVELSYTDYQLRVAWQPREDLRLRFLSMGAEDRFSAAGVTGDAEDNAEQNIGLGFHRLNAASEWDITRDLTWWTSTAWEYDHTSGKRASADDETISIDIAGWFINARTGLTFDASPEVKLDVGLDAIYSDVDAALQLPSLPPLGDPRPPQFDPIVVPLNVSGAYTGLSPFVMGDFQPIAGLRLLPGIRFNIDEYANRWRLTLDPKVAVRWTVHPQWTLKAATSLAHQPPPTFQVEDPYGDPDIPHVRAWQSSAGVEWKPDAPYFVSVEGFYNEQANLARPQDVLTTEDGELQRTTWIADVESRAYGLEVLLRKELAGWWYGWISYTLIRAERRYPPRGFELASYDQTHILNAAIGFDLGAGWTIGTRFQLTSGTPFYPVQGSRYDADRDRYQPVFADGQERLPVFHRLDLRIDKEWTFNTWILGAYVDIQNVYNNQNPESPRYSYDYRIRTDGAGVPILPTLGVKARF